MTELSFLIDLLLNHKLPKATRESVAARIKDVERLSSATTFAVPAGVKISPAALAAVDPTLPMQSHSTQAAMLRHAAEAPAPVTHVAQTQAAAAAMASREQAIAESIAGKVDKMTGRPRKF